MRFGFGKANGRPTRSELEQEAADTLAARIAEGRPSPESWLPKARYPDRHESAAPPGWYDEPPQADQTAPLPAPQSDVVALDPGPEPERDRPVTPRALADSRPFSVTVVQAPPEDAADHRRRSAVS